MRIDGCYCFMVQLKFLDLILGSQRVTNLDWVQTNNLEYRFIYCGKFHCNLINKSFLLWSIHWDRLWPVDCFCVASKLSMGFVYSHFLRVGNPPTKMNM